MHGQLVKGSSAGARHTFRYRITPHHPLVRLRRPALETQRAQRDISHRRTQTDADSIQKNFSTDFTDYREKQAIRQRAARRSSHVQR
jgi:hypothetical protein